MWCAGQVTDVEETKNAHKILVENLKEEGCWYRWLMMLTNGRLL
jgi:hypothetical protein